jgi:hypothetical protein
MYRKEYHIQIYFELNKGKNKSVCSSINKFPILLQGQYTYFVYEIKLMYNGNRKQIL